MRRVLLIEDNADLAFGLRTSLEVEGYEVIQAETGVLGLTRAGEMAPDLIVLDLMLPEMSGSEVLRRLRQNSAVPVLILTAKGEEADKVQGFRLGADDYVVKPVGVLEFLARVEALLRRAGPAAPTASVYRFEEMEIDADRRAVQVGGAEIDLSPLEFDLLHTLARRHGSVVSRAELLREVWGYRSDIESRTVDTHIAKLRAKIDRGDRSRIVTIRKKGYRLR